MADYKIVNNKYYVYPNTELEKSFMNGTATFPEGKELYVQMGPAYDAVKSEYTDKVAHIHNYDYNLVCVRKPEWAPDSPTPPQPTYKAIIVNDSYSLDYVLQYTSGAELNPSAVEVGKNVVFSTNDPAYTQTFPAGLEVEEYGTLPSGAVGYKFRMPDYDVEITITEVQPQPSYYDITVVDEYSTTHEIKTPSWQTITGEDVEAGSQLYFVLRSFDYEPSFDPELEVEKEPLPNGTGYSYGFVMPESDVTITIVEAQQQAYDINLVNEDSITVELYDENWTPLIPTGITEGTNLRLLVKNNGYEAVSSDVNLGTPVWESDYGQWQYQFTMPSSDITITIQERQTKFNFTLVNEDSVNIELYDGSWSTLDISQPISEQTSIIMIVKDYDYEATFSPSLVPLTKEWQNNEYWYYLFEMPSNDLTVSIVETPSVTLTVVNQDSRNINWYDGANWYSDTHTAHVGANIDFVCWQRSDKITFGSQIEYTEELDSEGRYQYHFTLNDDLTVTTSARTEAGIYYDGNTNITIQVGETPTYPTLENPNSVTPITYISSNTDLATVDSSGNVTLISNAIGEAYIKAIFEGDSTYDFTGTQFKITVKDGYELRFVPKDSSMRFYNITKQEYIEQWGNAVRPSDEIFVTTATYNDKIQYKDGSNTWTTISFSIFDPITIDGEEVAGGKFTMPSSGVADEDYILIMDSSYNLYDISKNFEGNLYNDQLGGWWYDEEDQSNPGTYVTKYPERSNLGIESRSGETYTINPAQTQQQGGTVGMYIVMPSEAIEITKTN